MAVLKYWGDPDLMFDQYLKRLEKIEYEEAIALERFLRQEEVERKMLGIDTNRPDSDLQRGKSTKLKSKTKQVSLSLLPVMENTSNLRALHEI